MNAYGRFEGGAVTRQLTTYDFGAARPASPVDLDCVRASGLAQVRLQLAVLSGNRRRALRELDRLVELDRQLETGHGLGAGLKAHLDEQREAIASEKLALMAAIEFPRLAPAERPAETLQEEIEVVEDTQFGRKLAYALAAVLGIIAIGTTLAYALPLVAAF